MNKMSNSCDKLNTLAYIASKQKECSGISRSDKRCSISKMDDELGSCCPSYLVPRDTDVIVGRSNNSNHIGNKNLRRIAALRIAEYANASIVYRSRVVASVLDQIYKNGGRFIKKDQKTGLWYKAENCLARGKIFQAFGDVLKQSNCRHESNKMEIIEIMNNNNNRSIEFNALSRYTHNVTSNLHRKEIEVKKIMNISNNRHVEFHPHLPAISMWFQDRGFPYNKYSDKWLCDLGVTSIEHLKIVKPEEWERHLLCQDEQSKAQPDCLPYSPITFRSFQAAIKELKKVKYDVMHAIPITNEDSCNQNANHGLVISNKRRRDDEDSKYSTLESSMSTNTSLKKEIFCLRSKIDILNQDLLCEQQALSIVVPKLRKLEKECRKLKELKKEKSTLRAKYESTNNDHSVTSTVISENQKTFPSQTYSHILGKIISQQKDLGCKQKQLTSANFELRKLEKENSKLSEEIAAVLKESSSPREKQAHKRRKLLDHSHLKNLFLNMTPEIHNSMKEKNNCDIKNLALAPLENEPIEIL